MISFGNSIHNNYDKINKSECSGKYKASPSMCAKYKQVNNKLDIKNLVDGVYEKREKLPPLYRFLMEDSCDYIKGNTEVENFVDDYQKTTQLLIEDIKQNNTETAKKFFNKEMKIIKELYRNCVEYAVGSMKQNDFDKKLEEILSKYLKD